MAWQDRGSYGNGRPFPFVTPVQCPAVRRGVFRGLAVLWALFCVAFAFCETLATRPLGPGVPYPPSPLGAGFVSRVPAERVPKSSADVVRRINRPDDAKKLKGGRNQVLIVYDANEASAWVGEIYAQQLSNLLSRFKVRVAKIPADSYRPGLIDRYDATFYLGLIYDAPLPEAFREDVRIAKRPVCWLGYNLWQVSWRTPGGESDPEFSERTGLKFIHLDGRGYSQIRYGNSLLAKNALEPIVARVSITDPSKAIAKATAVGPAGELPYIVRGGAGFWFVADNPMAAIDAYRPNDRLLAFADTLQDVLGVQAETENRAIVRIEDVRPTEDPVRLRLLADICAQEGVPFTVSVIPDYRDPNTVWPGGPRRLTVAESAEFQAALRYMEEKGGTLLMHGTTHQLEGMKNAWNGVSGEDFEFFQIALDANGNAQWVGPVPGDSGRWAGERVDQGLDLLRQAGFRPKGWVTPHYVASPADYAEFAKRFDYSLCRGMTFATGADGTLYGLQQLAPWPIVDAFGMRRIPETLGYVDPNGQSGLANNGWYMSERARALKAVRGGWAGCYIHPFLEPDHLRGLIRSIKVEGFRFVSPAEGL